MEVRRWKILLVDNDSDDYVILDGLFRDIGSHYQLTWIDHNEFIVDVACSGQFDLILLDYYLGVETGVDILNRVRARGGCVPIIILDGSFFRYSGQEMIEKGAYAVLDKDELTTQTFVDLLNKVFPQSKPSV